MLFNTRKITVIPGDGIGPEVIAAALKVIEATGVDIEADVQQAGASCFEKGIESGVPRETIESIEKTRVVLKGPLMTPIGHGNKSANVTLRTLFETFGNLRPVRELPGVHTPFTGRNLDIVIVRENVEDLYTGIEYMQTAGVAQALKIITRTGCEKIVELAFEFAVAAGRKRVHCATKANIMKLTEGMLQHTFEEIAPRYPQIEAKHILIDNCAHQLAMRPEQFDVIVTTNMNGDILSDLTSGLTGGLGFAPSANIGNNAAIFEAVHGSAPDIAGKNIANPTAIILSAAMLLRHIGEGAAADDIEQAVLVTLESGIRSGDMTGDAPATGTNEFADAIIANLGRDSASKGTRDFGAVNLPEATREVQALETTSRRVTGLDVFIESSLQPQELGDILTALCTGTTVQLQMIGNRGNTVFPVENERSVTLVDSYRCRFMKKDRNDNLTNAEILSLLTKVGEEHIWHHVEKLQQFDGVDAFSRTQK
ncbi:MAG TPA: NADP-dependent isocitrate dehydrogenase [Gemmatimonadaceae bacterium]|nr:NADP-dependent isocitrate dehydrogenase [Gemmatimonadaceae bacterium]